MPLKPERNWEKKIMIQHKTLDASAAKLVPPITLIRGDYERLAALVNTPYLRDPSVQDFLADELDRATIIETDKKPSALVTMNSWIAFRDEESGRVSEVTLVYPEDADIGCRKISVLTPIGAALLGLTEGQSIDWQTRVGARKRLSVLKVFQRSPG